MLLKNNLTYNYIRKYNRFQNTLKYSICLLCACEQVLGKVQCVICEPEPRERAGISHPTSLPTYLMHSVSDMATAHRTTPHITSRLCLVTHSNRTHQQVSNYRTLPSTLEYELAKAHLLIS